MLEALKSLIAGLENHGNRRSDFDDDDYQVAAAALLVHAASLDGDLTTEGRDKLRALLKRRFELDDGDADKLMSRAEAAEHDAVDIYHFTRLLNRALDEDGRRRIIEMMWQIAYGNGHVTDYEDNLIWRTADLLGVSSRERIALRERVAAVRKAGSA